MIKSQISLKIGFMLLAIAGLAAAVMLFRTPGSVYPRSVPAGAMPNFELFDAEGHGHELYRYADAKVLAIMSYGNDCPIVQKYTQTISDLQKKYLPRGVVFLAVDVSTVDTRESILSEAKAYGVDWPILRDPSQVVAKELGFTRTAEFVLVDTKTWTIVYRGPVDDRLDYGVNKGIAHNHYLTEAIEAMLGDDTPPRPFVSAKGCAITYKQDSDPITYSSHIAETFKQKCLNCHSQQAGIKPVFTDYEAVKNEAAKIRNSVLSGQMPPWGVDVDPEILAEDASLSPDQKRQLLTWIDAGLPRGEGSDPLVEYTPPPSERKAASSGEVFELNALPTEIPARTKKFRLELSPFAADRELDILGCEATLSRRARELQAILELPDGRQEPLLSIGAYRPGVPVNLTFRKPRRIGMGSRLVSHAIFDNTAMNPFSPDSKSVTLAASGDDLIPKLRCWYRTAAAN